MGSSPPILARLCTALALRDLCSCCNCPLYKQTPGAGFVKLKALFCGAPECEMTMLQLLSWAVTLLFMQVNTAGIRRKECCWERGWCGTTQSPSLQKRFMGRAVLPVVWMGWLAWFGVPVVDINGCFPGIASSGQGVLLVPCASICVPARHSSCQKSLMRLL